MELYKYCKQEHHDSLLSRGSLRVGSLYDYRKTDKYGELVGDQHEGKKVLGGTLEHLTSDTAHLYPGIEALKQARLVNIDLSQGGSIQNLTIENAVSESPDLLVFSAASEYSREDHERWCAAEGYDCCYKITSARLFFRSISRALGPEYRFLGFAAVIYEDRFDLRDSLSHVHPALVKRRSDSTQKEVRAVWAPTGGNSATPRDLTASEAWRYASPFRSLNPHG